MKLFLIIFIIATVQIVFPQSAEKWKAKEISYQHKKMEKRRDYSFSGNSAGEVLSKSFINIYRIFFSDVDGDNCPFNPSCSQFFIESVEETNLFQGVLMFADRFTRDMNFVNRSGKYFIDDSGRYYDPPSLYTLK